MGVLFQWSDEFLVGFKEIDDQHKNFVNILNKLFTYLEEGEDRKELEQILRELIDFAKVHFDSEEVIFEKYNYPHTKEHKLAHAEFHAKAKKLQEKLDSKLLTIDYSLLDFLEDWFRNHLKVEDAKYTKYFKENGLSEY